MVRADHEKEWLVNWDEQRGKDPVILRAGESFTSERKSRESLALLKKKLWPSWRMSVRTVWLQINERKKERDVGGWTESNYTVWYKPWFKKSVLVYWKVKIWEAFLCQRMSRSNLNVMGQSGCYEHNGKHEWKCAKCLGVTAAVKAKKVCS